VDYFKYLYSSVGRDNSWWYMLYKSREYLVDYLSDPHSWYITLMYDSQPAGFSIVTDEGNGRSNLAYIGLLPEFRSMGLGKRFLNDCLVHASRQSSRMWVYTTSLDHPRALPMYRAAGFSEIERKQMSEYFPTSALNRE
jgi:ribosomal protein S18 acetylase RimI-like enzyme